MIKPLRRISADEALASVRQDPFTRYPDGRLDGDRLSDVARIRIKPSFSFSKLDRIFTIGSCFARAIEVRLRDLGFDVPSLFDGGIGAANKYTIHSIENELLWAAGDPLPPPHSLFLETTDGLWADGQLIGKFPAVPLEKAVERREMVRDYFRKIADCRIVIMTLGLAESWFDHDSSLYLNVRPPSVTIRRNPGRFSVDLLSYESILASMERIHALLKRFGHRDFQMLVTVSPVPFEATFFGEDALSANSYSKAVQRAACQAFVEGHPNVDYFPSYEIASLGLRELFYETDNIHIGRSAAAYITDTAVASYVPGMEGLPTEVSTPASRVPGASPTPDDLVVISRRQLEDQEFSAAAKTCERILSLPEQMIRPKHLSATHMIYGTALAAQKEYESAADQFQKAIEIQPDNAALHHKLSQVQERRGLVELAIEAETRAVMLNSSEPAYRERLAALSPTSPP